MEVEEQKVKRCDPKHHASDRKKKIVLRCEIPKPMSERQTSTEEGIVFKKDMQTHQHRSPALSNMGCEALGCGANSEVLINEYRCPTTSVKMLAGVNILCDAHQVESVQFSEGGSSEDCSAPNEECSMPMVSSALDSMVEQVLFVGNA